MSRADEKANDHREEEKTRVEKRDRSTGRNGGNYKGRKGEGKGKVGSVLQVAKVVNRMHSGARPKHTHATHKQGGKEQALTSDSPGRPRPESDTFCHLDQKQKRKKEKKEKVTERRKGRQKHINQGAVEMEQITSPYRGIKVSS